MSNTALDSDIDRIASQYNNSYRFKKWLMMYTSEVDQACSGICDLSRFFNIDEASGSWLDVIGRIVGQPRLIVDSTALDIFGFNGGDGSAFGFDVGVFTDGIYGTGTFDSADVIYRRMIKARVIKNVSIGSINDIVKSTIILSGGRTDFSFGDLGSAMQLSINFVGGIDQISKTLMLDFDLLPIAAGVELIDVT